MSHHSEDILGEALVDYYNGVDLPLMINNKYGEPEEMPIEVFFRDKEDLTALEQAAILHCKGVVLDVGAGAGAITIMLQDEFEVTAIESSEGACQVMKQLGVRNGIVGDVFDYQGAGYDTLLLLMNGIGLVGELGKLTNALKYFSSLISADGQILLDSSDISYLYDDVDKPTEKYYGQLSYQYSYKDQLGEWFEWLYVDNETLKEHADKAGLAVEILYEDDADQYLARLTKKK
jgi:precorrin-6B methylase 2